LSRNYNVIRCESNLCRVQKLAQDGISSKSTIVIGMFHDSGQSTKIAGNVATGSERTGFTGYGVSCNPNTTSSVPNEAMSCLAGYWFDAMYLEKNPTSCVTLSNFIFWKIYMFGVHGEISFSTSVLLNSLLIADAKVGVHIIMTGQSSLDNLLADKVVRISNSLIVGTSNNNNRCVEKSPSLYTCLYDWIWCHNLNNQVQIAFRFFLA
jgi:hypothetical protein